ncbi:SH3 domain-containing protein [Clostridium sporogenes]|uniref:SH3 domain-containing protein n=1 Tax=Clostridium sporogenes TaxID=1509 RepID=UPI0013D5398D|nr:SH3 domain-containing protein [Clostridium sporogenes]
MLGKVTASALNVRNGASTSSIVIGSISKGTTVTIEKGKSKSGWYYIHYGSNGGYVSSDYVQIISDNDGTSTPSKPEVVQGIVTASSLNVRSGASTSSSIIGSVSKGAKVTIEKGKSQPGWYYIHYGSNGGYVSSDYIQITNDNGSTTTPTKPEVVQGIVTASSLNIRSGASTGSSIIGSVPKGAKVTIEKGKSQPGWYYIHYASNAGYVSSDYVQITNGNEGNNGSTNYVFSEELVEFIKSYEGFSAHHYRDAAGVDTIGYGSTHGWIMKLQVVTKAQATQALKEEINVMANQIKNNLNSKNVKLNQHQFDALCSFAYNLGTGALFGSTLYKRICSGVRDSSLKENFTAWCYAGGKVLQGLLNRRKEEYDMFMKGDYRRDY